MSEGYKGPLCTIFTTSSEYNYFKIKSYCLILLLLIAINIIIQILKRSVFWGQCWDRLPFSASLEVRYGTWFDLGIEMHT